MRLPESVIVAVVVGKESILSVGVASAVDGIVIPSGLNPRSAQYMTWTPEMMLTSVSVFMLANVQLVDAQRVIDPILRSKFAFLHQHRA